MTSIKELIAEYATALPAEEAECIARGIAAARVACEIVDSALKSSLKLHADADDHLVFETTADALAYGDLIAQATRVVQAHDEELRQ